MAGGIGLIPAAMAREIITGTTMFAEAVLEEVSLTTMAMKMAPKVIPHMRGGPAQVEESLAHDFGQLGVEHEIAEGDAAAE